MNNRTLSDDAWPDRNLALELVRVTENAALAAAHLVGKGDKIAADQAAVDGMHHVLGSVPMDGTVVIGEGEKDEAPMLFNGEKIGDGSPPHCDIAVDPLEGTRLTALGYPGAISVIALSPRGTMFDPGPCVYMEKLAGAVGSGASIRAATAAALAVPVARITRARAAASRSTVIETRSGGGFGAPCTGTKRPRSISAGAPGKSDAV